jgi:hypothetical protein
MHPEATMDWLNIVPQWLAALGTIAAAIAAIWIAQKQTAIIDKQTDIQNKLLEIEQHRDQAAGAAKLVGYVDYASVDDNERVLYVFNPGGERAVDVEVSLNGAPAADYPPVRDHPRIIEGYTIPDFVDRQGKIKIPLLTPEKHTDVQLDLRWRSISTESNREHWSERVHVYARGYQHHVAESTQSGSTEIPEILDSVQPHLPEVPPKP